MSLKHQELRKNLKDKIQQQGEISFADFMHDCLYYPGLGYYSSDKIKFGRGGDFITAPEISPLFGYTLAKQIADILPHTAACILEFGAGSGKLAAHILTAFKEHPQLLKQYFILEVSEDLKQLQYNTILELAPFALEKVIWLKQLPDTFSGVVLANEVLDAMPVHLFTYQQNQFLERCVSLNAENQFTWSMKDNLPEPAKLYLNHYCAQWSESYHSEINLAMLAWIHELAQRLTQGALLLIDYGFSGSEYYHPQRSMGTLMCHYQHQSHADPFLHIGLQDITTHVDFTLLAMEAEKNGLEVAGYTTQAAFLLALGILDSSQTEIAEHYKQAQALKTLLLPSEMGELFKIMLLSKQLSLPLAGFTGNDLRHKL